MLLGTSAAVVYRVDAATQNLGSIAVSGQVGLTLSGRVAVIRPASASSAAQCSNASQWRPRTC